jgi:hypothetical protein
LGTVDGYIDVKRVQTESIAMMEDVVGCLQMQKRYNLEQAIDGRTCVCKEKAGRIIRADAELRDAEFAEKSSTGYCSVKPQALVPLFVDFKLRHHLNNSGKEAFVFTSFTFSTRVLCLSISLTFPSSAAPNPPQIQEQSDKKPGVFRGSSSVLRSPAIFGFGAKAKLLLNRIRSAADRSKTLDLLLPARQKVRDPRPRPSL